MKDYLGADQRRVKQDDKEEEKEIKGWYFQEIFTKRIQI